MKTKLYIIVLHFGNPEITKACIRSIKKNVSEFEQIVVVDNNVLNLKATKNVVVIKNKKNLGYAGGMNAGIRYALSKKADYLLLLNNDTLVESDLSKMIQVTKIRNVGIMSPAI